MVNNLNQGYHLNILTNNYLQCLILTNMEKLHHNLLPDYVPSETHTHTLQNSQWTTYLYLKTNQVWKSEVNYTGPLLCLTCDSPLCQTYHPNRYLQPDFQQTSCMPSLNAPQGNTDEWGISHRLRGTQHTVGVIIRVDHSRSRL